MLWARLLITVSESSHSGTLVHGERGHFYYVDCRLLLLSNLREVKDEEGRQEVLFIMMRSQSKKLKRQTRLNEA